MMTKNKLEHYYKCLPILMAFLRDEKQKGNKKAQQTLDQWDKARNDLGIIKKTRS